MNSLGLIFFLAGVPWSGSEQLAEHILQVRGEPLREISGLTELHVRSFGAVPDDGIDDSAAIQSAIAALSGGGNVLRFSPGVYDVGSGGADPVIALTALENVVVDGGGAQILIHRPEVGFCTVSSCANVIVRNFTVDYAPLPFSQGTVVDLDATEMWIEVETDPGYPALDDPFFENYESWGMLKDPEVPGKLKDGAPNFLPRSSCEEVGSNRFRIVLTRSFATWLDVGDRYAQVGRTAGGGRFYNSTQLTFDNITFYACPGALFVGSGTSYLNVLNCRALLTDGRLVTSGADGVHCQSARVGPWIEGCAFEGLSDDCLNVYTIPFYVQEVVSDTQFVMSSSSRLHAGDRMVFFRPQTGEVLVETEVAAVNGDLVTFTDAVTDLNLAPAGTVFDSHAWKIYDHAYNLDTSGNYFVYLNNVLHDGRRYGGFIKASFGLIEGNRFERLSNSALQVKNLPDWPEGFWARNLVIRDNQMIDCAFINNQKPVEVGWDVLGYQDSEFALQGQVFFESNTVRSVSGGVADFSGVNGLTLIGNTFESGSISDPLVSGSNTTVTEIRGNVPADSIQIE